MPRCSTGLTHISHLSALCVNRVLTWILPSPASQFMIDAANPTQIAASCVQLLSVLSAEQLASAAVLILFNKM